MNTALNYQPEVLVDTADLSREDWLNYRRLVLEEAMQRQSWAYPHLRQSGICISIKLVLRQ